ncbi:MAG TPA: hypothetical protein VJH03_23525 [Blastocatellia bacterium]|nr:hypothetical protein [Blastocatellia bacterium]
MREEVFRPSRVDDRDKHQLGWRVVRASHPMEISFQELRSATSEGVNALAVLCDSLDFSRTQGVIELVFDKTSLALAEAMGFGNLSKIRPRSDVELTWHRLKDSYTTGPNTFELRDETAVAALAQQIVECSVRAVADLFPEGLSELADSVHRIATEALLNVYEHAFRERQVSPSVMVCASMTRARDFISPTQGAEHEVERTWVEQFADRYIFDLAISDAGVGIPRTLWLNSKERYPELFDRLSRVGSGSDKFKLLRAEVHRVLCIDAFHHESTCKQVREFHNDYHALNWRGLYRGRQRVIALGGFVALSSGKGRAGFAAIGREAQEFLHSFVGGSDLPGTTLVVRFPLPVERLDSPRTPRPLIPREARPVLTPSLSRWQHAASGSARKLRKEGRRDKKSQLDAALVGLVFPFCPLSSEHLGPAGPRSVIPVSQLLRELRTLEPELIPILFCVDPMDEPLFILGRAAADWSLAMGHPRLVAIWQSNMRRLSWRVAGVVPAEAVGMIRELEDEGRFKIVDDTPEACAVLARELSVNYPAFVDLDPNDVVTLKVFAARIDPDCEQQAFEIAFADHWSRYEVKQSVVTDELDRPVRLHTGTLVRRYLCVLYLVESSTMLASIIGRKMIDILAEARSHGKSCSLVTDDDGSSFVAKRLLCDQEKPPRAITRHEALRLPAGSEVVLFVDAIFRGRTVTELAQTLAARSLRVRGVITCVDLRRVPAETISEGIPVRTLMKIERFQPDECMPGALPGVEIQVDRVTHVPVIADASDFLKIAPTQEATNLLSPGAFDHGLHQRGGRLHTISLPVSRLLASKRAELNRCLIRKLRDFLTEHAGKTTDVVFFYRSESEIGREVSAICKGLVAEGLIRPGQAYHRPIPTAQRGARTIFSHIAVELLAQCQPLDSQLSMFTTRVPGDEFVALYLDDAAVTGRAVRSFVFRAMRNAKRLPKAIMALIVVNRLSPGELRLFSLCHTLEPVLDTPPQGAAGAPAVELGPNDLEMKKPASRRVPFTLDSLFRLQVYSREEAIRSHALLRRVREHEAIPNREVRGYLQTLVDKLGSTSKEPVRHIFSPKMSSDSAPLSTGSAQLRHLLALHQQNEGVVAEILGTFADLKSSGDRTLLNVLALEPELLDEPPLSGSCRSDIVDLCVDTLISSGSISDKSDSLAVLSWYETQLFANLTRIAPHLLRDESLCKQLVLFMLTVFSPSDRYRNQFLDAMDRCSDSADSGVKEQALWARDAVAGSVSSNKRLHAIKSFADAESCLRELVARMARHSPDLDVHWEGLINQLRPMLEDWNNYGLQEARSNVFQNMRPAFDLVDQVFIPALAALIFRARDVGDEDAAIELREAHEEATVLLSRLRPLIPVSEEDVTHERVSQLLSVFDELRKVTWAGKWSSSDVLSYADLGLQPAAICKFLPHFYSAPGVVLYRLINQARREAGLPPNDVDLGPKVVVCNVPVDPLRRIMFQLIDNVSKHGEIASLELQIAASDSAEPTEFIVRLNNRTRHPEQRETSGVGLRILRDLARKHQIRVISEERGDSWFSEIGLSDFFIEDTTRVKG